MFGWISNNGTKNGIKILGHDPVVHLHFILKIQQNMRQEREGVSKILATALSVLACCRHDVFVFRTYVRNKRLLYPFFYTGLFLPVFVVPFPLFHHFVPAIAELHLNVCHSSVACKETD